MAVSRTQQQPTSLASFRLPSFETSFPGHFERRHSVDRHSVDMMLNSSDRSHQAQPPRTPVFVAPLTPGKPPKAGTTPTGLPTILDGRSLPLSSPVRKRPANVAFDQGNYGHPRAADGPYPSPPGEDARIARRPSLHGDADGPMLRAKPEPEGSPGPHDQMTAQAQTTDGAEHTGSPAKKWRVTIVFGEKTLATDVGAKSGTHKKKASVRVAPLQLGAYPADGQNSGTIQPAASSSGSSNGQALVIPPMPSHIAEQISPASPMVMGFDAASALQDPSRAPTVRKSLNLKEQQKALIESRRNGGGAAAGLPARRLTNGRNAANQGSDNDGEFEIDEPHTSSIADRRGEKARNLTIQTATQGEPRHTMQQAETHVLTSVKSAPIRPDGYQAAVQTKQPNTSYPRHTWRNEPSMQHASFDRHQHQIPQSAARLNEPNQRAHQPNGAYVTGPRMASPVHHHVQPQLTGVRLPAPSHHYSGMPPAKAAFLSLFDTFYDSLGDSRVLSMNLDDQIRRSSALLATLQQSSGVFENMLDRRIGELTQSLTADLQVLEGRIERLERAHESHGDDLPPLTPSLMKLQQKSFRHLQQTHASQATSHDLRRHSVDSSIGIAETSASIARRLDRLEHERRANNLSHHAASTLHSLAQAAEASKGDKSRSTSAGQPLQE